MADAMFGFVGGGRPKPLTRREIEEMKKIMKKVPAIKKRNDDYHETEKERAEREFKENLKKI